MRPGRRWRPLFASASGTKAQLMYTAHVEYGYTLREIAAHLGVHYTTVSKLVRKVEQERQEEGGRGVPPGG
ncbi:MAG: hypothetical protein KatS3mg131_2276 [Candidatus Tectimicrobiota bacterium]|nr:MAG: hypothetical protein KatS3mg131_2276 [Candidatus Tectomicrobia bacterium]